MDRIISKRKIRPKLIIFISLCLFTIGILFIEKKIQRGFKVDKKELIFSKVINKSINEYIQVKGIAVPINKESIESMENGIIENIPVLTGSFIEEGEVIISLINNDLNTELSRLNEELNKVKKELTLNKYLNSLTEIDYKESLMDLDYDIKNLKTVYERNITLYSSKVISKASYLNSYNEYKYQQDKRELLLTKIDSLKNLSILKEELLSIDIKLIEDKISSLRERIELLNIRATTSGIINIELLDIGQSIYKQQRVAFIEKQNSFKIVSDIDEYYLNNIMLGDKANLITKNKNIGIRLSLIKPEVVNGKVKVEFSFNNKEFIDFKSGQKFNIKIQQSDPVVKSIIKNDGFYKSSGGKWIFKVENNIAYKVPITIGIKNRDYLEVVSGLEENDIVIVSNADRYKKYEKLIIEGI